MLAVVIVIVLLFVPLEATLREESSDGFDAPLISTTVIAKSVLELTEVAVTLKLAEALVPTPAVPSVYQISASLGVTVDLTMKEYVFPSVSVTALMRAVPELRPTARHT